MACYVTFEFPSCENEKAQSFYLDYFFNQEKYSEMLSPGIHVDWIYFYNESHDLEICIEAFSIEFMVNFDKEKKAVCIEARLKYLYLDEDILYEQMLEEIEDFEDEDEEKVGEFISSINIDEFILGSSVSRYCIPYSDKTLERLPYVKITSFRNGDTVIPVQEWAFNDI